MTIQTDGERITGLNSVVNPEKLGHLGQTIPDYTVLFDTPPRRHPPG